LKPTLRRYLLGERDTPGARNTRLQSTPHPPTCPPTHTSTQPTNPPTHTPSSYLDELCKAITQDGVKFTTYWAWSLWDNFEVGPFCLSRTR
jgi:hypothetical protein